MATSYRRSNSCGPVHMTVSSSETSSSSLSSSSRPNSSSSVRFIAASEKRSCVCSPTMHPGSFRCSLHRDCSNDQFVYRLNRLNDRRSAMTNSLVRIGTVEDDLVKRALAALIRPSSHQQRRRGEFKARLSRFSMMSKEDDGIIYSFSK